MLALMEKQELQNAAGILFLWGKSISFGCPILASIDLAEEASQKLGCPDPRYALCFAAIREDVKNGESIKGALLRVKDNQPFPKFVINMIGVGEECGNIDEVMLRTAEFLQKIDIIQSRLLSPRDFQELFFWGLLGLLLDQGIPMLRVLNIIQNEVGDDFIFIDMTKMIEEISSGASFNGALKESAPDIPKYQIMLACAAEISGVLDLGAAIISQFCERKWGIS